MKTYSSNLTDSRWKAILNMLKDKRKRKHTLREIFEIHSSIYLKQAANSAYYQYIFHHESLFTTILPN